MNELGELRPSQLIYTFGVGALLDLPSTSALILGLDDWDTRYASEIVDERLLGAVQKRLGPQVKKLLLPPMTFDDDGRDPTAPAIGVPVAPFPRWLRCPNLKCGVMATIDSGIFKLVQDQWRPDKTRYVHGNCSASPSNPPTAFPVRFLMACREGHLSDFPWIDYVHNGIAPCRPSRLSMREYGAAGDASDIVVKCHECGRERRMGDAFDQDAFRIKCHGHHPHLRRTDPNGCKAQAKTTLLGASNIWFPMVMSALSLPPNQKDKLGLLVAEHWAVLKDLPSKEVAAYVTAPSRMPAMAEFGVDQIWEEIEGSRGRAGGPATPETADLKAAEWALLNQTGSHQSTKDFRAVRVNAPRWFEEYFEQTILLERMREVRALLGFTRIESTGDFAEATVTDDDRMTPLCRESPSWLPASEVRGEGILLRVKLDMLKAWEEGASVQMLSGEFLESHKLWRQLRKKNPPEANFPRIRYVLLHSLSHALMRQISIECGYTASSIRERIYCSGASEGGEEMAGILIYTAASDSEGTLGGLVQLGQPLSLGRQLRSALESMRICGSDPLCAEHHPVADGHTAHGGACHACLFAPETSCEKGNRFLDRSTLLSTLRLRGSEFFHNMELP
jgi:hypothetical protein